MAIEIPALVPDRMPHPDWAAGTAPDRFQLPASKLLEVLGEAKLPLTALQGIQELASTGGRVDLLLSSDRSALQLLVDGRRVTLTGPLRDAVLQMLGDEVKASPSGDAGAHPAGGSSGLGAFADLETAARIASVGAQVDESLTQNAAIGGGEVLARPNEDSLAQAGAVFTEPLMARAGTQEASQNLAQAVESSGLFLEAHVAQWLRGERSLRQIDAEVQALAADIGAGATDGADRRGAQQLEAVQRQAVVLAGPAWLGQPVQIEIERDRERHREAANLGDATGMFTATIRMSLPHLGAMQAKIRVMENTVGVQIESAFAGALTGGVQDLASALSARGLKLVQLAVAEPGGSNPGLIP